MYSDEHLEWWLELAHYDACYLDAVLHAHGFTDDQIAIIFRPINSSMGKCGIFELREAIRKVEESKG